MAYKNSHNIKAIDEETYNLMVKATPACTTGIEKCNSGDGMMANVLWLDQPADVGYSYGQGNDSNEEMISEDAYYFLQAFFKSDEGEKYRDAPLHIVGESYGGHYAPAIAHRIWKGNNDLKDGLATLNLKGLAVGNGLTDPEEQYKH